MEFAGTGLTSKRHPYVNFVLLFFVAAAWIVIQCLIGGTRLLFSLPAYGLLAAGAIISIACVRTKRAPPNALCILSTLLLGAWVLVRAALSPIEYLALPDYFMMIGCLMVYLLTAYFFNSQRDRTILLGTLWAIAALEIWCGLIQFLRDPHYMLFGLMRGQNIERASGLFISPNHFAGFLEAVAIISVSMLVWSRWPVWAKFLAGYMAVSCWLGVAISGSRGGYFSTIFTLVIFSVGSIYTIRMVDRRKFVVALVGLLSAIAVFVAVAAFLMGHSELLTRRMNTMVVKDVRIYNWEAALDHIKVSPWIGTGAGTHTIFGRLFRRPQIQADPIHAHCDYLELLAEYGIVGGVCMLFFVGAHYWNGVRAFGDFLFRRLLPSGIARSNSFALNFGALCAVAGLAAHSVVDFNTHIPGNALLFAFIFGLLANPGIDRAPGYFQAKILPWGRLLLPALGIWMACSGLRLLPSEACAELARGALRDHKFLEVAPYANLGLGGKYDDKMGPYRTPPDEPVLMGRTVSQYLDLPALIKRFGGNPANSDLYFYAGESNRALGARMPVEILKSQYYTAAIPYFRDGLQVFPQDENMLVRLAQSYDGLRQYQMAEDVYQQAMKVDPRFDTIFESYATHLAAEGKQADAAALVKQAREMREKAVDSEQKSDSALQ